MSDQWEMTDMKESLRIRDEQLTEARLKYRKAEQRINTEVDALKKRVAELEAERDNVEHLLIHYGYDKGSIPKRVDEICAGVMDAAKTFRRLETNLTAALAVVEAAREWREWRERTGQKSRGGYEKGILDSICAFDAAGKEKA